MNCPICNAGGLPDYKVAPINCPQCNSDLSAFMHTTTAERKSKKKSELLIISFSVSAIVIVFFLLGWFFVYRPVAQEKSLLTLENLNLIDSLKMIGAITVTDTIMITEIIEKKSFQYIVKNGDNLEKIALFFYGNVIETARLVKHNNIVNPDIIYPGQIIEIPIINL